MVDNGASVSIFVENKIGPGQGAQGNPTQVIGNYSFVPYTANFPNDQLSDRGVSADLQGVNGSTAVYYQTTGIKGKYINFQSGISFPNDFSPDKGPSVPNTTAESALPKPPSGGSGGTTYYKMVGYYTTGAVYESFVSTGSPASSTTTNPSTGHTLINTYVASTWTV